MMSEITIYGNSAEWLICAGVKLFTLRLDHSKYAGLTAGKEILIRYEQGYNFGKIFSREVKPLRDYTSAELYLDGYMSAIEASKSLRTYPGYQRVTLDTPLLGIGITSDARFDTYLKEESQKLLFSTSLSKAVLLPELHSIFLPSYLWWTVLKKEELKTKITVLDWHNLLSEHLRIFDPIFLKKVRTLDESTKRFYSRLRHKSIREIIKYDQTNSSRYRSVVLCQPISVDE